MLVSLSTMSHIIKELDRCDSYHFKLSNKQVLKVHKELKHFGIKYDKKTIAESAQGLEVALEHSRVLAIKCSTVFTSDHPCIESIQCTHCTWVI